MRAPWMGDMQPGDNLYSTSVIALDVDTGKIRGHHQYHWNDSWDWDEVSAPLLIDVPRNGRDDQGAWCTRAAMAICGCWSASRRHRVRRRAAVRHTERLHRASIPKPDARAYDTEREAAHREDSDVMPVDTGAAKTGRRPRTTRRRSSCTFLRMRTCAAHSMAKTRRPLTTPASSMSASTPL